MLFVQQIGDIDPVAHLQAVRDPLKARRGFLLKGSVNEFATMPDLLKQQGGLGQPN